MGRSCGRGSTPWNGALPVTGVAVHTSFFMPSCGWTQGPPVSLQPGEELIDISMPYLAARRAA